MDFILSGKRKLDIQSDLDDVIQENGKRNKKLTKEFKDFLIFDEENEDETSKLSTKVEKPYLECSYCYFATTRKRDFKKHVASHSINKFNKTNKKSQPTNIDLIYKCPFCKIYLNTKQNLMEHYKTNHRENIHKTKSIKEFKLSFLNKIRRSRLISTNLKKGTVPFRSNNAKSLACRVSSNTSTGINRKSVENALKRRVQIEVLIAQKENLNSEFKCYFCNFWANSEETMKNHVSVKHDKDAVFKCNHCSFSCQTLYTFVNHSKRHRLGTISVPDKNNENGSGESL